MDDRIGQFGRVIALSLEGESYIEIAKKLGVARSTLYLWRDDPVFQALEAEMHRQQRSAATAELTALVAEAVGVVRDAIRGKFLDPAVARTRLAGAREVFERIGLGAVQTDHVDDLADDKLDELAERVGYVRKPAEGAH